MSGPAKSRSKVLALIQARMGSTRLPGKVLSPILGKPMLQWQLERLEHSRTISSVVVATSNQPADDAVQRFCAAGGHSCYRGSETSVLSRFHEASLQYLLPAERGDAVVIRLTGDCPLVDPFLIDEGVELFLESRDRGCRYQSYDSKLPDGMDFEVFTWQALDEAMQGETDDFEKEHATPVFWRNPDRFGMTVFTRSGIPEGLRFSVDYAEDRELVEGVLRHQQKAGKFLGVREIAELLETDVALRKINANIVKNEGLFKTSFATPRFRTRVRGEDVAIYGLRAPAQRHQELEGWARGLGMRVWDEVPPGWQSVRLEGDLAANVARLRRASSESGESSGIVLETTDRGTLAAALTYLCQTRFMEAKQGHFS